MNNKVTINSYLKTYKENKELQILLRNYCLNSVSIDLFFKYYEGKVTKSPESVANFILDKNNSFELSMLGHRASGESNFYAYNGKGKYNGTYCTVGARHSRYHG
ncbi:MAG: hypothetical protein IJ509_03470 [Bacilli bacterium]|nr:hypothetical protein [Bacilli bacterium]